MQYIIVMVANLAAFVIGPPHATLEECEAAKTVVEQKVHATGTLVCGYYYDGTE